jgi:hypothetical protein
VVSVTFETSVTGDVTVCVSVVYDVKVEVGPLTVVVGPLNVVVGPLTVVVGPVAVTVDT